MTVAIRGYTPEAALEHRRRHAEYIQNGGCSRVHRGKAWCKLRGGHDALHFADGIQRDSLRWSESEAAACPCLDDASS